MDHIVFLDRKTITVPVPKPKIPHTWTDFDLTAPEDIDQRLKGATIVVTNKVRLGEPQLAKAKDLKMIAVTATGYDNIDVTACRKRGIVVANVPGYAHESVPEHVMMLILALRRNLPAYQKAIRENRWEHAPLPTLNEFPIDDLGGARLALIGYGNLARGVERLAKAFGMKVVVAERKGQTKRRRGRISFEEALRTCDVISLHTPLNESTRNMIGPLELALMKPTSILINAARGGIVDEMALADALAGGRIGGAGFDVLSSEPPREGNPLLELKLTNVIVTPHVAWTSRQAQEVLVREVIKNIESFAAGKRRNRVS